MGFKISVKTLEEIIDQDYNDLMNELNADFLKQVEEDFDQVKNTLGIESTHDDKINALCFGYRCGAVKGIMRVIKLIKEGRFNFQALDEVSIN